MARIKLDRETAAAELSAGDQRRAEALERIEHATAATTAVPAYAAINATGRLVLMI